MSKSVWIEGFEGQYQISDDGVVTSHKRGAPRRLKYFLSNKGYFLVELYKACGAKNQSVHRLVAKHFVPGFEPGLEVNHKNGIKTDNRAINLEWVTHQENVAHANRCGLVPKSSKRHQQRAQTKTPLVNT